MEGWLQALLHYGHPERFYGRWMSEIYLLIPLPFLLALEIWVSGWKESSVGAIRQSGRSGRWEMVFWVLQISGILRNLSNLVFFGLVAYLGFLMNGISLNLLEGLSPWIQIPAAVLLYDFLHYWNHYLRHKSDWIWQVHEFHHCSTKVNLLTNYLVHPLDNLIRVVTIALPLQLLIGLDLKNSLIITIMASLPGICSHARIDRDFGWLGRYVFVTPRFHQMHHALSLKNHANFGNAFVFWDRLFGTYVNPNVPIIQLEQGIEDNFYLREPPLKALLRPIGRFYAYPFQRVASLFRNKSPVPNAER